MVVEVVVDCICGFCVCVSIVQDLCGTAAGFKYGLNTGLSAPAVANIEFETAGVDTVDKNANGL